jgi:hypothetical protein
MMVCSPLLRIFLIESEGKPGGTRSKLVAQVEHFVDISLMGIEEAAERIQEDRLLVC